MFKRNYVPWSLKRFTDTLEEARISRIVSKQ